MGCNNDGTAKELELSERGLAYMEVAKKWFKNDKVIAATGGKDQAFKKFTKDVLEDYNFDLSDIPSMREIKILDRRVNNYIKDLFKTPTILGKYGKLPEVIANKHPIVKEFFQSLVRAEDEYRGNQSQITSDIKGIAVLLNESSGEVGIMQLYGHGRSKAQKKLAELNKEYEALLNDKKNEEAEVFYRDKIQNVLEDASLVEAKRLYDLMVDPTLMNKQNFKKTTLEYGGKLVEAASLWHYGAKDIKSGKIISEPLKDRLWKILANGLKTNINILENMQTTYNKNTTFKLEKLNKLYDDYFSKGSDRIKNYFPRQVLDIAPTMSKLSEDIHSKYVDKSIENRDNIGIYIDNMVDKVTSALREPGNIYERTDPAPARVSRDVLGILDTYSQNAMRFNHSAFITQATVKALRNLQKQSKDSPAFKEQLDFFTEFVRETHDAALGLSYRNSKLKSISRFATAWEFISKIGLNPRSWARNATQTLQNYVWFGHQSIFKAYQEMKQETMKNIVNDAMRKNGFEFVNIQEVAMPRDLLGDFSVNSEGKVVQNHGSMSKKFGDYLEKVANVTGKPMQWVENHINRGATFKIAFLEKWRNLGNDTTVREQALRAIKKKRDKDMTDAQFEELIASETNRIKIAKSSTYASNVVKELHYLYDMFGKPKAIRGPIGGVLGQFATYSINFFEYQRKILSKGSKDVLSNEWNTPEAWRMYRFGMNYLMVTALSAISNTAFTNLLENDTWERIKRIDTLLTGDKDSPEYKMAKKIQYKGGPLVSDIITLLDVGTALSFTEMSDNEYTSYLDGYMDFHKRTGEMEPTEKIIRTLNTGVGRMLYTHLPRGAGNWKSTFWNEFGLYSTPELQPWRDAIYAPFKSKYAPKKVREYFKEDTKGNYAPGELQEILKSLQRFR